MAWTIEYLSATRKQLRRLDPQVRARILNFMGERVAQHTDPYALGKALTGEWVGHWRYQVGDYRIICQIGAEKLVVMVVRVGHRGDVYRTPKERS